VRNGQPIDSQPFKVASHGFADVADCLFVGITHGGAPAQLIAHGCREEFIISAAVSAARVPTRLPSDGTFSRNFSRVLAEKYSFPSRIQRFHKSAECPGPSPPLPRRQSLLPHASNRPCALALYRALAARHCEQLCEVRPARGQDPIRGYFLASPPICWPAVPSFGSSASKTRNATSQKRVCRCSVG